MFSIEESEDKSLQALGKRLETVRLSRNETQSSLAARIGVSTLTYQKMEKGLPTVKMGYWVRVLRLLSSLDSLELLFAKKTSFFEERDKPVSKQRKRARKNS